MEGGFVAGIDDPVGPALRDDLVLGPETHALLAILADVAEARAFPPAEAVVTDRHRDRHVDPDHPDIHSRVNSASAWAVAGENRDAVAEVIFRGSFTASSKFDA